MDDPPRRSDYIEGDYIETIEGLIFTVKGLFHPEGQVIAYLRYVPDVAGDRFYKGARYRRVYDISKTTDFLERRYPQYLSRIESLSRTLQSVPTESIVEVHKPVDGLRKIRTRSESDLEKIVERFTSAISSESGVKIDMMGVTGSVLIGLSTPFSDVDIIVYGEEAGRRAYKALKKLREEVDWISPYDEKTVKKVVDARWGDTELGLERFKEIETLKVLHGYVAGRDYFVRLVKWPREVEQETRSRPIGEARLKGFIAEDRDSIYTPCTYRVKDAVFIGTQFMYDVSELVSFRGKFTEQVLKGEYFEARGVLEEVEYRNRTVHRLILGGSGDYLFPISAPPSTC